ncbi:4Fe-4S dicluster domain-containing protein [Patescibacteria group bacterium]|nr:4Fe-4S dicluster domain-containing protein [Patescibacteria group bacterium]MBU1074916.1 4Fe-4S dicluster domain-containing protein [Patescibacteria group bacterium]MBU1952476.1 4Fe-4S dicluster domain-containing protein [Patescibacteria group bacterium]
MAKFNSSKLVEYLLKNNVVFAPVERENELLFQEIHDPKEVSSSMRLPKNSFKPFLLPHDEVLFDFENPKKKKKISPQVIYGISIVDLKALILFDQMFAKDPHYQALRQNTLIVGQCIVPDDPKFLNVFEENILERLKFDVLIDRCRKGEPKIFTGSRLGQQTLEKFGFTNYEHVDFKGSVEGGKLDPKSQKLKEQMKKVINDKAFWEKFAKDCIMCGKCTVACPTCYCFDLVDEGGEIGKKQAGVRKRRLSSCFYDDFASIAGGENFLKTKAERLRNYYMHKFIRTPERQQILGCVGCLRCFQVCPVGIDIRKILEAASKVK